MASFVYDYAAQAILNGTLKLYSDTTKVMLVNSGYTPAKSDHYVTASGAGTNEITATNYTRGYGGAGRLALTPTISVDTSTNMGYVSFTNLTWSSLGGATNDTVVGAIVIKEGTSDDTTSLLIAYWQLTSTPTNGSNFTLTMASSDGNLQLTC